MEKMAELMLESLGDILNSISVLENFLLCLEFWSELQQQDRQDLGSKKE